MTRTTEKLQEAKRQKSHKKLNVTAENFYDKGFRFKSKEHLVDSLISELSFSLATSKCSIEGMSNIVFNYARTLTWSENGYVSLIGDDTKDNICYTLTGMIGHTCKMKENKKGIVFPIGENGLYPSLWGYSLNTKISFYTNDPASHPASCGFPENHIPINNFLSIPVMMGESVMGQICLANSVRDYDEDDLKAVNRIATHFALAVHKQKESEYQKENEKKEFLEEKLKLLKEKKQLSSIVASNNVVEELKEEIQVLNLLLKRKESERVALETNIRGNMAKLVFPYLDRLKEKVEDQDNKACLNIVYQNIMEVFSPMISKISSMNIHLTPQESQVALLIKSGMQTKEISNAMNISVNAVNFHRKNIRSKFGLQNKSINLYSYLCSLEEFKEV